MGKTVHQHRVCLVWQTVTGGLKTQQNWGEGGPGTRGIVVLRTVAKQRLPGDIRQVKKMSDQALWISGG